MTMTKTVVILEHEGGRLGNQLWNYASIVAYCIERGYTCINRTFDTYARYFENPLIKRRGMFKRMVPGRIVKALEGSCAHRIIHSHPSQVIYSGNHVGVDVHRPFYLPPSDNVDMHQVDSLVTAEASESTDIYLSGWLFRNPYGMMRHHRKIRDYFRPAADIATDIDKLIEPLRRTYAHIIGVHIRKKDYRQYWGGQFYLTEREIRPILEEYLERSGHGASDTAFIICSDDTVDMSAFDGLNVFAGIGQTGHDLFTLARCDLIIGSDSTYGAMAAYLGNIPIIFLRKKDAIDWGPLKCAGYTYHNGSLNIQL